MANQPRASPSLQATLLDSREDAEDFLRDHAGAAILRFEDLTLELLRDLDEGWFDRGSASRPVPPQP